MDAVVVFSIQSVFQIVPQMALVVIFSPPHHCLIPEDQEVPLSSVETANLSFGNPGGFTQKSPFPRGGRLVNREWERPSRSPQLPCGRAPRRALWVQSTCWIAFAVQCSGHHLTLGQVAWPSRFVLRKVVDTLIPGPAPQRAPWPAGDPGIILTSSLCLQRSSLQGTWGSQASVF